MSRLFLNHLFNFPRCGDRDLASNFLKMRNNPNESTPGMAISDKEEAVAVLNRPRFTNACAVWVNK